MAERSLSNSGAEMGVIALVGIVLGLIGPFGTEQAPLAIRFAYWIGGGLIAWAVLRVLVLAMREITKLLHLPDVVSYVLAVPLLSALLLIVFSQLGDETASTDTSLWLYLRIVGLGIMFFVLFWLIYFFASRKAADDGPAEAEAPPATEITPIGLSGTALHEKLPAGFGPVIALSVEDHYVKAHADGRSEMLLMNLSEATAMMKPDDGLQVHRSWWVARTAVLKAKRAGRNLQLELVGGLTAPVSRAKVAAVREAGWLDR